MEKMMTLEEVAGYLSVSKDSVYRMAQTGAIPASKVGLQWRFHKDQIIKWLEENSNLEKAGRSSIKKKELNSNLVSETR